MVGRALTGTLYRLQNTKQLKVGLWRILSKTPFLHETTSTISHVFYARKLWSSKSVCASQAWVQTAVSWSSAVATAAVRGGTHSCPCARAWHLALHHMKAMPTANLRGAEVSHAAARKAPPPAAVVGAAPSKKQVRPAPSSLQGICSRKLAQRQF